MRLINIDTYTLEEFFGDDIPPYAILSHRWEEEEFTFQQISRSRIYQATFGGKSTKGYQKVKMAGQKTASFDLRYLWIDTCCIDKSSSAELSEAINSMFRWYENADVCLAYLSDIERLSKTAAKDEKNATTDTADPKVFKDSIWFTRAWTLQELIAPREMHFYSSSWEHIGTKESLATHISSATKIPKSVLLHKDNLNIHSIAEKMSWAAGRKATRTEDIAYSLLGLFNVYMPLLYGEGNFAFIRLQEEIIRRSLDRSFLLWSRKGAETNLLATSPDDFAVYRGSVDVAWLGHLSPQPFSLTNAGLEIELDLFWWQMNVYAARIASSNTLDTDGQHPAWYVLLKYGKVGNYLTRAGVVKTTFHTLPKSRTERVTIKREALDTERTEGDFCGFEIHSDSLKMEEDYRDDSGVRWDSDPWADKSIRCAFDPLALNTNANMTCDVAPDFKLYITVSVGFYFNPMVCINRESHKFFFGHGREKKTEPDLQMAHGALTGIRPPPGVEGTQRWICKIVDRKGAYVPLPDFLCPIGWRLALYIDFILYPNDHLQYPFGIWHIALTKRENNESKSTLQSFIEDRFFADQATSLKTQMVTEKRWLSTLDRE